MSSLLRFLFLFYFFFSACSANFAKSTCSQAFWMNGCSRSWSAEARFSGGICRHCPMKWLNSWDHFTRLLFNVGDLLVVISSKARRGGSFSRGGSPSAISIAVMPRLQMSTCRRTGEEIEKRFDLIVNSSVLMKAH